MSEDKITTVRKTITLTSKLDEWIKSQTNGGELTNDSEYIRDFVRRDRDQKSKLLALRAAIQEGLDSGVSDRTVGDIWAEAEARHQSKNG